MSNKESMPPTFENDYQALVFLIERYNFKGGWIGAGGMGPEIEVDIQKAAPKWAKSIAVEFVFALHSSSHPALNMAGEVVDCSLQQERSRILLTRNWSSPITQDGPRVLKPRVMEEAITIILGIESVDLTGEQERCELRWDSDPETGEFIFEPGGFALYDGNFDEIACDEEQSLKILEVLRKPSMTERKYWSSFASIDSIVLSFSNLNGDFVFSISGETKPEDITDECLRSSHVIRGLGRENLAPETRATR
jgi:hypothetical protein